MKIYTRTGDDGTTGLFSGARVEKISPRIEAHGAVDELNSLLGVARAAGPRSAVDARLHAVQRTLFAAGADLATPADAKPAIPRLEEAEVAALEAGIDEMDGELPPLRTFILPGGTAAAAQIQLARAVARRAERDVLRLAAVEPINDVLPVYLNRLSDFLFTLARWENHLAGRAEEPWIPETKNAPR